MIGRRISATVATLATACLLVACGAGVDGPPKGKPPASEAVKADLPKLLADWAKNPTAISEKYRGKRLRVRGYVGRTDTNLKRQTYVELFVDKAAADEKAFSDEKRALIYFLDESLLPKMKDFPKGSEVVIDGGIASKGGTFMLEVFDVLSPAGN